MIATYIDEWNDTLQFCSDEGKSLGSVNSMYLATENQVSFYIQNETDWPEIVATKHTLDRKRPYQELLTEFNRLRDDYLAARARLEYGG